MAISISFAYFYSYYLPCSITITKVEFNKVFQVSFRYVYLHLKNIFCCKYSINLYRITAINNIHEALVKL